MLAQHIWQLAGWLLPASSSVQSLRMQCLLAFAAPLLCPVPSCCRQVRALFAVAAHVAPSVIFIDEVDSLLSARKSDGEQQQQPPAVRNSESWRSPHFAA